MSVNLEVKGSLAKCLATENLIIEHKKVPTACFDVDKRVLTLPMWHKASPTVYDLLVGHEVGHALFTDNIDWTVDYPEVPKDFVNVVEDVRVERLMKKKYPGLSKTFYNGYNELNSDDFFSTKDENLDKLNFIDRINLYFKIGAFHNISFTDEENEFLTRITKLETFTQVLDICRELVKFLKYERKKLNYMPQISESEEDNQGGGEEVETPDNSQQSSNESMEIEQGSTESSSADSDDQSQGDEKVTLDQEAPIGGGDGNTPSKTHDEFESKTSKSFDEKSQELTDQHSKDISYAELPEILIDNVIIPNEYIHQKIKKFYSYNTYYDSWFAKVKQEYINYKKSAEKEVSYLVKEFECKKSADQYARSTTARTGVLDTCKLHTYKYNEDLFKKVSMVPDGKNHGLIFILDWSGSMSDWMLDTCKQMYNLIWFCKKVNIPFEVYAFTVDCNSYVDIQPNHPLTYKNISGIVAPEKSFRLLNFFSSKTNSKEFDDQMKNIWACCYHHQNGDGCVPRQLELSGSPLGDTMLALHEIIPDFQKKNKLQKVNVVFLTDGEGYVNSTLEEKTTADGRKFMTTSKAYATSIRNRKNGRIYPAYYYGSFPTYSKVILTTLKDKFPTVNFINFRIVSSRDFKTCYDWYGKETGEYEKIKSIYKKEQFITFTGTGYDQFNVIPSTSLSQNEDFEVVEGATKAQIKNAFTKMLSKKKTNKKLLSSFVDIIA